MDLHIIDPTQLWDQSIITDLTSGEILILTPILASGEVDPTRTQRFLGRTGVVGPRGQLNLQFDLPGTNLAEALAGYAKALRETLEKLEGEAMRQRILQGVQRPPGNGRQ